MFQLDDRGDGLPAHVLDRILVTEPVGPFDRIVHMPLPTVFAEVAETGLNAESGHCRYDDCDNHNDKRERKRVIVAIMNRDRCLYRGFAEASRFPS